METIPIYLMPGMAANSKIFENLSFPAHYQLHYLEWLDPIKNETLPNYIKRLSSQITHENPVLIGVSMGGIIVQELKNLINTRRVIIISSIKSKNEFSPTLKFLNTLKVYKIIPFLINNFIEPSVKLYYGKKAHKYLNLYNYYLTKRDKNYLNWALQTVAYWNRVTVDDEIYHIQGSKDEIFPVKYIKNCKIVPNGTHIMIINKAKTLSKLLIEIIENEDRINLN